ncbi:MAG: hypothetical protein LBD28_03050 [Tannerellaceae bacterium]|jgi:hypothetical protein|nr:hypothetical protein [Tannerellaceae bacterium]
MKKITYLLLLLALVGQFALAQRTRPIVVQFNNGNVLRGEVYRLPDNRLRIYAGNGIVVNFAPGDVRSMTYADDNSRVTSIPPLPQQRQQNNQAQQQQRPPNNQQNRQGTQQPNQRQGNQQQGQQGQQNRQGTQQPNQRQGNQQQGNQQNRQGNQQGQNNRQNNQQQQNSQNNQASDEFFFEDEGLDLLLSPTPPSNKKPETKKQDTKKQDSKSQGSSAGNRTSAGANSVVDQPFSIRPRLIIEGGYTMGMGNEFAKASRMEGSFSFGAQVTRDLFVGIGAGINMFSDKVYFVYDSAKVTSAVDTLDNMNMSLPIFLDVRYNIPIGNNGKIVPFVGLKGGTSFGFITRKFMKEENTIRTETKPESLGLYISPSVGAKYMLTNSLAVNMSLGYTMQMRKYVYNAKTTSPMNRSESMSGITIRIGLEF